MLSVMLRIMLAEIGLAAEAFIASPFVTEAFGETVATQYGLAARYEWTRFLDAVTRPILRPAQRIIPSLGGVDVSPILVILVLQGARIYLLPWAFAPIRAMIG